MAGVLDRREDLCGVAPRAGVWVAGRPLLDTSLEELRDRLRGCGAVGVVAEFGWFPCAFCDAVRVVLTASDMEGTERDGIEGIGAIGGP